MLVTALLLAALLPIAIRALDEFQIETTIALDPAAPDGEAGWYRTAPRVTLEASPTAVGPVISYGIDTTATMIPYLPPYFDAPDGEYTLFYEASATVDPAWETVTFSTDLKVDSLTPPASAEVTVTAISGYRATLAWTAVAPNSTPSGLAGYDLYLDDTYWDSVPASVDPTMAYEYSGLSTSTVYAFGVRARNVAGALSDTETAIAMTTDATSAAPPRIVYARGTNGETVHVNWETATDTIGPVSYRVLRSDNASDYSQVATVTTEAFVDEGLRSSREYWYRIQALDDHDLPSDLTTPTAATTGAPARVRGVETTAAGGGAVISWSPSSNPTGTVGYYVYRAVSSMAAEMTTLTVIPTSATAYIDPFLANGTYWYRLAAIDSSGAVGARSAEARVVITQPTANLNPHGEPDASTNDECAGCHRGHTGRAVNLALFSDPSALTTEAAAQVTCLGCHNGIMASDVKTPLLSPDTGSRHDIEAASFAGTLYCVSCHSGHRSNEATDPALLDVDGARAGTDVCYGCHGAGAVAPLSDLTVFEGSSHATVASGSQASITCAACHDTHTSADPQLLASSGWMLCVDCHDGSTPPATDILSQIIASDDHRTRHDVTAEDQSAQNGSRITCANCHNAHAVTDQYKLVDPDDPSPAGEWTTGVTSFCLTCHDGVLPTPAQTMPWVEAPLSASGENTTTDLAAAYQLNVHGYGESTVTALYLRPEMGYAIDDVLSCRACHDGHGTVNPMNLRQNIPSADGLTLVSGRVAVEVPGGGMDLRFLCSACHEIDPARHLIATGGVTSIDTFPLDCTECHSHSTQF